MGAMNDDSFSMDAGAKLIRTLAHPSPGIDDSSGESVAMNNDGTKLRVGAPSVDTSTSYDTGAAYLFDDKGNIKRTFKNPATPSTGEGSGNADAISRDGTKILVR